MLVVGSLVAGCGGGDDSGAASGSDGIVKSLSSDEKPVRGGTLTFARNVEPVTFTPWVGDDNGSIFAIQQVLDQLAEYEPGATDPQPALARSWEISEDGLTYTFELRDGVKFSNGDPLTAEDVRYSLENFADPKVTSSYAFLTETVDSVSIVDPQHVRVKLSEITPAFLDYLCIAAAGIVSKSAMTDLGPDGFGQRPVGTGPFIVTEWRKGESVTMERNPHYWRAPEPYLDKLVFRVVQNDNTRTLEVQSGQTDVADAVPYSRVEQLSRQSGLVVLQQELYSNDWIFLNTTKPPLDEVEVRQALVHAAPLEQIREVVFKNLARSANSANLPTKYWNPDMQPLEHDPEKARELLAGSSVPDGFKMSLQVTTGDEVASQLATILQKAWADVGIDLSVQQLDPGTMAARLENLDYDAQNWQPNAQTSDVAVDDEFDGLVAFAGSKSWPSTGWDDAEAQRLVSAATSTLDEGERKDLFADYQEVLRDQVPLIGIAFPPSLYVVRDNVRGFASVPEGWPILRQAWLAK